MITDKKIFDFHFLYKLTLIVAIFVSGKSLSQPLCSDYQDWNPVNRGGSGLYYDAEVVHYNGRLYSPCYFSTTCHVSDAWCVTETGCGWTQWGFVGTCTNAPACSAPAAGSLTTPAAICSGQSTTITGSAVSGAGYEWYYEPSFGSGTFNYVGNTQSITTAALTTTTRYIRRTTACSPLQYSAWVFVTVTVTGPCCTNGTVNAGSNMTVCQGATSGGLGGSIGGGATGGTWTASSGTVNNATDYANATYTANGATGNITLTLTTSGGCAPVAQSKIITVNSNANNPGAISVPSSSCVGSAVTITDVTSASTGSPASSAPTYSFYYRGGPSNVGYVNYINSGNASEPLPAAVINTAGSWFISRNSSFACAGQANNGTTLDIPITITALPTASAGGALTAICRSATSVAMGGSVGGSATGGTWSGGAGSWTNATNPSTATYTAGASESGSITLTLTTSGGSCGTTTATKNITVNAPTAIVGGALAAICQGGTSAAMGGSIGGTATGGTWSGGAGSWTNATNPATATYTASAGESGTITLTLTTSGGSCGTTTATKNITVNAPTAIVGGALAAICQGGTSAAMGGSVGGTATGGTWSGGAGTWTNATNSNTATYTASAGESGSITLTLTTSGGACGTTTATKNITVNANPTAAAGGALSAICRSGTSAAMGGSVGGGATGGTWTGGAGTWTNATNPATATYTAGAAESGAITLTLTTSGGSCGTTTATKNITVNAPTANAGGALATICQGATSAAMGGSVGGTAIGGTWSASSGTVNNPTDLANATYTANGSSGTITLTLTSSGGACGTTTATKTITVSPTSVGGSITTATSYCSTTNSATLTLAGHTGSVTKWQYSTDNWATPIDIVNTGTTQAYTNVSTTTKYRAVVSSGVCTAANSSDVTITIYSALTAGTIGSAQTVMVGATPAALTETVAHTGGAAPYTYQWQSSTDNSTWANAAGTSTSASYSPAALTSDTWFKRIVTSSGACGSATSASVKISVVNLVCAGSAPTTTSSASAGSGGNGGAPTYQWQYSTDGTTYTDIPTATGTTHTPSTISQETWYRRATYIDGCVGYSNVLKANTSQGSPGSVSSGLLVWLKANTGTSNIASQWEDQSGNGNHYTTVAGPTVSAGDSSSNFNPYVNITSGGFDAPAGATLGSEYTIILAAKRLASDNNGRILDGHTGNYAWGYNGAYSNALNTSNNPAQDNTAPATTSGGTYKKLQSFVRNSSGTLTHYVDGTLVGTYSSTASASGVKVDINAGANLGSQESDCVVYELIIYNSAISPTELDKVESYLMTKYRIGENVNYLSSTSTTTFDVSNYNNDIIGLGKECYFQQKQSESQDDPVRIFISTLAPSNAQNTGTITNNVSYVMIGHNGGKLKATAATKLEIPAPGTDGYTVSSRISREWKVRNTNFVDPYSLEIELEDTTGISDLADLCLLVDGDGDFSSGSRVFATGDGITFRWGSIIIDGIDPSIIPDDGSDVFITLASKDPDTALPIELGDFNVHKGNDHNLVTWITLAEVNNSHFEVQKSVDGIVWETIATVKGAGSSSVEHSYAIVDYEACESRCYYRLHQVDFDGKDSYSMVKVIENVQVKTTELIIYPVPVNEKATVKFIANNTGMHEMEIFSVTGALVFKAKVICVEGENIFDLNTYSYSSGSYYLVMKNSSGEIVNRNKFTK